MWESGYVLRDGEGMMETFRRTGSSVSSLEERKSL